MVPRQRFEARHSVPFYIFMALGGLFVAGLAIYTGATARTVDAEGRPVNTLMLWGVIGIAVVALGYYIQRGVTRVRDRRPVVSIDQHGVTLRIDKIWEIPWDQITRVELHGFMMRVRLEMQIDPQMHADMHLPTFLSDDNFIAIKRKPFTIGIGGQGLDRKMSEALDSVRGWRPNLVKR